MDGRIFYLLWIVAVTGFIDATAAQEENVALKGFASQSSNFDDGYAIKAIDGNRDGNYFCGSCTHTKSDLSPWWKLDLQQTHKVSSITITNRQDAVPERLNGAEIRIGDNPAHSGIQNPRCGVISSIGKNPSVTFQCNGMKGRYVTIVNSGRKEFLTLCEVEDILDFITLRFCAVIAF
ncbi:fucolectin-like [Astyanax mexicanus]|uniref:Fucolectin-like n=1 Tax=Astyanax mexicanus TaxID=7994 RepID=A0A8T2KLG6_ASTMX|nr:fucolectin-like [Astyanax mexicanus]